MEEGGGGIAGPGIRCLGKFLSTPNKQGCGPYAFVITNQYLYMCRCQARTKLLSIDYSIDVVLVNWWHF